MAKFNIGQSVSVMFKHHGSFEADILATGKVQSVRDIDGKNLYQIHECDNDTGIFVAWENELIEVRKFQIGDRVKAKAFTSGGNEYIPEVTGLIVQSIQTIAGYSPHHRLMARTDKGERVEAAEHHFEFEISD